MRLLFATIILVLSQLPINAQAPIVAPSCGRLLPMITESWIGAPHRRLHFVPAGCNQILVDGTLETIPAATAVISGGVMTDVTNACVDKICGVQVPPNMLYRIYVYKDGGELKINWTPAEHSPGPLGNEINAEDAAQSFVGLAATDESGRVCGGMNLCLLSWFNRGHVSLGNWIRPEFGRPAAESCNHTLQVTPISVKVLTFGINAVFRQGYNVPNFYVSGTMTNTELGKNADAAIAISWGGTPVTFTAGAPGKVTWSHYAGANIGPGTAISFRSTGLLPAPLVAGRPYHVLGAVDADRFTISSSTGGQPLEISTSGTGRHLIEVGPRQAGPRTTFWKRAEGETGPVHAVAIGALGAEEGWIKASLMLSAPNGGCAQIPQGMIYTSPHDS